MAEAKKRAEALKKKQLADAKKRAEALKKKQLADAKKIADATRRGRTVKKTKKKMVKTKKTRLGRRIGKRIR